MVVLVLSAAPLVAASSSSAVGSDSCSKKQNSIQRFIMPRPINIAHFSKNKKRESRVAHINVSMRDKVRVESAPSYAVGNLPISCRFILFSATARVFVEQTSRSPQ